MFFFVVEMRGKGWCVYGLIQVRPDLTRRRTSKTGQEPFVSKSQFSDHGLERITRILDGESGTTTHILQEPLHCWLSGCPADFLGVAWGETPLSLEPRARVTPIRMASRVAAIFRSGDQVWICSRAMPATDCRRARSVIASLKICARASTSPQGKMNCGATGATRSRVAPTRSLTTTGHLQHMASLTTTAKGSYSEGRTMRSAEV